jgi:hypothetical protein
MDEIKKKGEEFTRTKKWMKKTRIDSIHKDFVDRKKSI